MTIPTFTSELSALIDKYHEQTPLRHLFAVVIGVFSAKFTKNYLLVDAKAVYEAHNLYVRTVSDACKHSIVLDIPNDQN